MTMADMDGNETFDPACLGTCETVKEERVGDGELLYCCGCVGGGENECDQRGVECWN